MISKFVPEMKEDRPCPYCGGPTVNVAFEYITCGAGWNRDCFGHQVKTPIKDTSTAGIMRAFDRAIEAIKRA